MKTTKLILFLALTTLATSLASYAQQAQEVFELSDGATAPGLEYAKISLPNGDVVSVPAFKWDAFTVETKKNGDTVVGISSLQLSGLGAAAKIDFAFLDKNQSSGVGLAIEATLYDHYKDVIFRAGWRPGGVLATNGRDYVVMYAMIGFSYNYAEIEKEASLSGQDETYSGVGMSIGTSIIARYARFTLQAGFAAEAGSTGRFGTDLKAGLDVGEGAAIFYKISHLSHGGVFDGLTQSRFGIEVKIK